MARFLHTADWQMGLRAVHAGAKSKEIRANRFEAASCTVALAKAMPVDFVMLAGDTFEHHDVDEVVVKRTVDILNRFAPIPVYVLPGNHDPWLPGGVWDRESWKRVGSHVILCTEAREVPLGSSIAFYPCPLTQKRSSVDPTSWIPRRVDGDRRIRIGVAHGSLDVFPDADLTNFPISQNRPESSGLDYLALGDWHGFLQHGRAVYSGTMEPTSFSERDAGYAVVVEITAAGGNPGLERHRTRALTWAECSPTVLDATDVEALDDHIKALGPLASLVLRLAPTLDARADAGTVQRLEALKAELEEEAFLLEWESDADVPLPDAAVRLPDGVLPRVEETLCTILEGRIPEGPGQAFAGHDRTVVHAAWALLHRLARGGT